MPDARRPLAPGRPPKAVHFDVPERWGPKQEPGLDPPTALRRLRRELADTLGGGGSVLPVALDLAPADFHARLSAVRKRYSYRLATTEAISPFEARYCWRCGPLDLEALSKAAACLDGRLLDYSNFTIGGTESHEPDYHGALEKTCSLQVRREGADRAVVLVSCDRFLYRMVRRIVGGLVEAGPRHAACGMPLTPRSLAPRLQSACGMSICSTPLGLVMNMM